MPYAPEHIDFGNNNRKRWTRYKQKASVFGGGSITTKFIGVLLAIIATVVSVEPRVWANSAILNGTTNGPLLGSLHWAMYVPVVSLFFVHGLPGWAWYSIVLAWIATTVGIILIVASLWNGTVGMAGGIAFGTIALIHQIAAFVFATAISLVTKGGFSMLTMAKLYVVTRPGIFGIGYPIINHTGVFAFSQITWAVIVIVMLLTTAGSVSFGAD